MRTDISFPSSGVTCEGWHYTAMSDPAGSHGLRSDAGRPCVVMAHGFGATRDCGLAGFAEAFAAAGMDVVLFDYRYFGTSAGEPRQYIDLSGQIDDYHAAISFARGLDGVDPEHIAIWGVSMSGGHVLAVAANDHRLAAAVSLTPAVDGLAVSIGIIKRDGLLPSLRGLPVAIRDVIAARRGKPPVYLPLAGQPGEVAGLTAPGAYEAYTELSGPTWRNEFTARTFLQVGRHRPALRAPEVECPTLVQIGDIDQSAPPLPAVEAARKLRQAEVRHYPCDHFDVYPGADTYDTVVEHQIDFLSRHLGTSSD